MSEHTKERLQELQALPLQRKIGFTAARIAEWYNHYQGKVYISFSGGKDSTVLLYLVRQMYPDVKAVFVDTGLQYPEIKDFVKTFDNVEILRPQMNFRQVIEKYGYPVISKQVARCIYFARKKSQWALAKLGFDTKTKHAFKKKDTAFDLQKYRYMLNAPFAISDHCCNIMKKTPTKNYTKKTGLMPILATMAEQSLLRQTNWIRHGCNAFNCEQPKSAPMSFWTEQDVLQYIKLKKLPIASIYGNIQSDSNGKLYTTGAKRTGCVYCLFGITYEKAPNRIQRLAQTHPKLYDYCLNNIGLKKIMEFINVPYQPEIDLFNYKQFSKQDKN